MSLDKYELEKKLQALEIGITYHDLIVNVNPKDGNKYEDYKIRGTVYISNPYGNDEVKFTLLPVAKGVNHAIELWVLAVIDTYGRGSVESVNIEDALVVEW